jgi:hypothetical protein
MNEDQVSGSWAWQTSAGEVVVAWDEHAAYVTVAGETQQLAADEPAYLALESLITARDVKEAR